MTIEQKRRELFEAWWKAEGRHRKHQGIINGDEEIGFELWCAALDAVVIELPRLWISNNSSASEQAAVQTLNACKEAIESTGLGLKVKS